MENTSGTSPLQTLVLSDCFDGKTDQEILNIIAQHLTFTTEAGQSIQGNKGDQGPVGPAGATGPAGTPGTTPTQNVIEYNDTDGVSAGATYFDIPLDWSSVVGAEVKLIYGSTGPAPALSSIVHFENIGGGASRAYFNAALSGNNWVISVGIWA